MKKVTFLISLCILSITTCIAAVKPKLNVKNTLEVAVLVKAFKGGKLDNLPMSRELLSEQTIAPGKTESLSIKVKKKDIVSIVGEFPDGSEYLFWSGQIVSSSTLEIDIDDSKFEIKNKPEEYLKRLQEDIYKDQDIDFIVEKTNSNASDVFKSHLGGLAIVKIKTINQVEIAEPIDLIPPDVLGRAETPKFIKDRAKNFSYVFDNSIINSNSTNIPGIADIDFQFNNSKLYSFNYSMVGFGKIIYTDPASKSIEQRWDSLNESTKNSFMRTFIQSVEDVKDKKDERIEVRVYNRCIGFKGMYLRIEEFEKTSAGATVGVSSFFSNDGIYNRSQRQEYEDIFGEFVLAVGFNGQIKTAWMAAESNKLVQKAVLAVNSTPSDPSELIETPDIKEAIEGLKINDASRETLLKQLEDIQKDLTKITESGN